MIGIVGEVFLVLALIFCGVGIFKLPQANDSSVARHNWPSFLSFLMMAAAFGVFMIAHITDHFELLNVYLHSHTQKPILYKIAGAWASHEGSFLLWCVLLSAYHVVFDYVFFKKPEPPLNHSRIFLYALQVSFILFLMTACNPFERLMDVPAEGQDLNPLLQDISLVIHPPHLYLGALGFVIPFVLSLGILIHGSINTTLLRHLRRFLLLAETFLTIGIVLGCRWAYYELGWGGWWFFDPVENLALMPWLLGLIALHLTLVSQKTGKHARLSLIFSMLPFLQSLMGLACVRSGMLNSVHAFGQDPLRSIILWMIFGIWTGVSIIIYIKRKHYFAAIVSRVPSLKMSRRSLLIFGASILILLSWLSLFLGTMSPVILDIFGGSIVLDNGFYAWTFVPLLGGALILIMGTPVAHWAKRKNTLFYHVNNLKQSTPHLLAHGGALLSVVGMILSFSFGLEINHSMKKGETYALQGMKIHLDTITKRDGPNYHGIAGNFLVHTPMTSKPVMAEERIFWTQKKEKATSQKGARHVEAGLFTYTYLSQGLIMFATTDNDDVFTVRIIIKPFINLMWAGFVVVILGLSLATGQRFRRR